MGDHIVSGDFHYGEMEMKLLERRPPGRYRHSEWWYGRVSGYGTRPGRAFAVLCGLLLAFAAVYYKGTPWLVDGSIGEAIALSLKIATLQRPEIPMSAGRLAHWVVMAETLLGPAQVALFLFALRMRVRR
jgi:hypothetical protein